MRFKLEIKLGNEAMQDGAAIAAILERVAADVHFELPIVANTGGTAILDLNGNSVGRWEIVKP